jgi:signal transduction histidine kinase
MRALFESGWRRHIVWTLWLIFVFASSSAAQPAARQVLVLKSFERHPFDVYTEIFRTELSRLSPEPINFFEVSIQPSPFTPSPDEQPVLDYLESSLAGRPLDLVVSVGGPAAAFTQEHRADLFPTTPLLHLALDRRFLQGKSFGANETAVDVQLDLPQMIEQMLLLLPETDTVFVVIGASQYEEFWRKELARDFERFKNRLTFVWLNELSFTEMLERASALPPRSAMLYAVLAADAKGVFLSEEQALDQLHAVANRPIFGLYDIQLGHGIVGGPLLSAVNLGHNSAAVALGLLRGESPQSVNLPSQRPGQPSYDWRELQRWNISEARLPAGSLVQFRQLGMWDQYKVYLAAVAILLGLQSALIGGLVVQRARRRRTEIALRESEQRFRVMAEENQDLAGRLINAQEEERSRIARDLHDDVSQQIAGVGIILSSLKRKVGVGMQPEVEQAVVTLQSRTSAVADAIRTLSHELHPSVLQHAGLVATLQRHCSEIEQHHHAKVTFSAADNLDGLSPDVALCLFRVAQEALANAVRHARASAILVQLKATTEGVELSVSDDGTGFATSGRNGRGLGLRSIDERVRLNRGIVKLESRPGHGTTLRVRIPDAIGPTALVGEFVAPDGIS